jgi:myo-inositol-1(or 4)-monophosphatase
VTEPTPPPVELASLAREVARAAGRHALELRRLGVRVSTKSTATDMVTDADRATEALIVERLLTARPHDGVVGEEGGERAGSSGVRWVIDPIDGTTNFVYDLPGWAVSIAAEVDGAVVAGAVVVPNLDAEFHAAVGQGAWLGDRRLELPPPPSIDQALIGTGFGYAAEDRAWQGELVARLLPRVRDIRRYGAAAVDLCLVAAGRLDAYFEFGLQPWDLAAGGLIAAEAGARLGTSTGEAVRPGDVVACHPDLFRPLVDLLAELGAGRH